MNALWCCAQRDDDEGAPKLIVAVAGLQRSGLTSSQSVPSLRSPHDRKPARAAVA